MKENRIYTRNMTHILLL